MVNQQRYINQNQQQRTNKNIYRIDCIQNNNNMLIKVLGKSLPINRKSDITPSKTGMVHTCGVHDYSYTIPEVNSLWKEIHHKKKGDTIVRKRGNKKVCLSIKLPRDGKHFPTDACVKCLEANVIFPNTVLRVQDVYKQNVKQNLKQNRVAAAAKKRYVICPEKKTYGMEDDDARRQVFQQVSKLTTLLKGNRRMQASKVREVMNGLSAFQPWHDVAQIQNMLQKVLDHLDNVMTTPKQSKAWTTNPNSGLYSGNHRRDQARKRLVQLLTALLSNVQGMPEEQRLGTTKAKKDVVVAAPLMKPATEKTPTIIDDIQMQLEEMGVLRHQLDACREEREVSRHQLAELKGNVSMLNDLLDEKDRIIRENNRLIADQTKRINYLVDQMMDKGQEPLCSQQYHDSETTYTGPSSSVKSNMNDLVWGHPSNMHW